MVKEFGSGESFSVTLEQTSDPNIVRAGWAIVELMGHRVCIGWARRHADGWVEVDVHAVDDVGRLCRDMPPAFTCEMGATSIYCLTWVSAEDAAVALRNRTFEIDPVDWKVLAPQELRQQATRDEIPF